MTLKCVVIDLSGRPGLVFEAPFTAPMIRRLDTQLIREFFQGFVNHAQVTLHVDNLRGIEVPPSDRDDLRGLRTRAPHGNWLIRSCRA